MLLSEAVELATSLAADAFAARFPDPMLLSLGPIEVLEDGVTFATPTSGLEVKKREKEKLPGGKGRSVFEETWKDVDPQTLLAMLSGDATQPIIKAVSERPAPSPHVIFVTKSNRNPFLMMVTVGRTGNNDIVLDDITVSKVHGYFVKHPGDRWTLHDQRSTNGTFVGDKKVPLEGLPIADGQRVAFGNHHAFRFHTARGFHAHMRKAGR
ncbi:FHA domain-containing protein [bacterium]|nr:FHA domain-containing protein [bacterium]